MKHLELDLTVDFESRTLQGHVVHHLDAPEGPTFAVRLHTRDLEIESVRAGVDDGPRSDVEWGLQPFDEIEGRTLLAQLPEGANRLEVVYKSQPGATGLQWLEPSQTAGGDHPYLYSQGQSTHNRTWIPCFDDPAARITFDAVLRVPAGMRAVMAAEDRSDAKEIAQGIFRYHMPQPIPSYLIAMAVGNLVFREMSARTGVWTEPAMLDKASAELGDTERMIEAVEEMFGEYRWGRYDVLVLPPSFPLGGMENPRLTFATPTILAGDRSLVALIAHELAHSWSGNLVTNETWDDFWLNEGFTVYLERRIQEKLYGRARSEMEASIGRSRLEETIEELGAQSRDTWLYLDIEGRHPDEAMTDVPYEKGYLLLRLIEDTYGRERFDRFLRGYFDRFAFETMTTERFLHHLKEDLLAEDAEKSESIRLDDWVFGPGIPSNAPRAKSDAMARVADAARSWSEGGSPPSGDTVGKWTAHEWIHFLRQLPRDLPSARLGELDAAFALTASHNSEILCEWLKLAVRTNYEPAMAKLDEFLCEVGRRKFVKPLFEELARTPEGAARARDIYARSRKTYHSMTSSSVDEILAQAPKA